MPDFRYTPDYEKLCNWFSVLVQAWENDTYPADYLPEDPDLREKVQTVFGALHALARPYRRELEVFFHREKGEVSFLTRWRMRQIERLDREITMEEYLSSLERLTEKEWLYEVLTHYTAVAAMPESLAAESFRRALMGDPGLTVTYIQALELPDAVRLGLVRLAAVPAPLTEMLTRFLRSTEAAFECCWAGFAPVLAARQAFLAENLDAEKAWMMAKGQRPGTAGAKLEGVETVSYGSLLFQARDYWYSGFGGTVSLMIGVERTLEAPPSPAAAPETSRLFKYLDNPRYMAILRVLSEGEKCVAEIQRALASQAGLSAPQSSLSGYLTDLYEMELLCRSSDGAKTIYSINPAWFGKARAWIDAAERSLLRG